MWNWERERRRQAQEDEAQLGLMTLGGGEPAANLGGERRWLSVCAPGGMQWMPQQGEQVLVLKSGEEAWILGVPEEDRALLPGQTRLNGTKSSVFLGDRVEISGEVMLNGESLKNYIRAVVSEMMEEG